MSVHLVLVVLVAVVALDHDGCFALVHLDCCVSSRARWRPFFSILCLCILYIGSYMSFLVDVMLQNASTEEMLKTFRSVGTHVTDVIAWHCHGFLFLISLDDCFLNGKVSG